MDVTSRSRTYTKPGVGPFNNVSTKSFLYFLKKSCIYTVTGNYANLFMPWNTVQVGVKHQPINQCKFVLIIDC
jgi:hypothetical protein